MSSTVLIGGLAVVGAMLIALFFKLSDDPDKKHFLLQILFLGFIVFIMVLVGKASFDEKDHCNWLVSNSTTSGLTTSYDYVYSCSENTNSTHQTFYTLTVWIMRIVMIYVFLYFSFEVFNFFRSRK
jgi:hypothetical protein